jgi:hypothetical protein
MLKKPLWARKGYDPASRRDFARDAARNLPKGDKAAFWKSRFEDGLITREQYEEELKATT